MMHVKIFLILPDIVSYYFIPVSNLRRSITANLFDKLTVHTQWSHRHYIIPLFKSYQA